MVNIEKRSMKLFKEIISWSKYLFDVLFAAVVAAVTTTFAASMKVALAIQ